MEYHSFLLATLIASMALYKANRFRLLMEYHSFLLMVGYNLFKDIMLVKFPSPYGVIFILTILFLFLFEKKNRIFPSPYRVIFILTRENGLIEKQEEMFLSPYGVSFILIYDTTIQRNCGRFSFRLLTELYSFLLYGVSLRMIMRI